MKIRPLTPDLWPALEDLFGAQGACNGCWCMYWRVGAEYRKRPGEQNRAAFHQIVQAGPPPGLIAFDGELAVGWCQLTPRHDLPWLNRNWRLRSVDEVPVWSLSCFYVRIGHRGQVTKRVWNRLCLHVPSRRIQDCRLPFACASRFASRLNPRS